MANGQHHCLLSPILPSKEQSGESLQLEIGQQLGKHGPSWFCTDAYDNANILSKDKETFKFYLIFQFGTWSKTYQ